MNNAIKEIKTSKGTFTIERITHSGEWMLKLNGVLDGHFKTKKQAVSYAK